MAIDRREGSSRRADVNDLRLAAIGVVILGIVVWPSFQALNVIVRSAELVCWNGATDHPRTGLIDLIKWLEAPFVGMRFKPNAAACADAGYLTYSFTNGVCRGVTIAK